ncbi:MAG: hypothetical protein CFE24_02165 [Flavobacterium sp. BFFFF2]|nr:MAG: hypothetical protein CFE24_02165 [Flavobacterium sp. BFFFF2]
MFNPDYALDFVMKPTLTKSLHLQTPIKKSWFLMTHLKTNINAIKMGKGQKSWECTDFFYRRCSSATSRIQN